MHARTGMRARNTENKNVEIGCDYVTEHKSRRRKAINPATKIANK